MTDEEHPGLLFDERDLARIRHNVATFDWAQKLFTELRDIYDGRVEDPWQHNPDYPRFTMAFPPDDGYLAGPVEPGRERDSRVHQVKLMEFALFALTSRQDKYVARVVELLPRVAELLAAPCDLAAFPQVVNWAACHDAADALVAYDLVYHHPSWTVENRRRVEESLLTIGRRIEGIGSSYHLCNSSFYYQVFRVIAGCFFDREDWIDTALECPGGVKSALSPPEPTGGNRDLRWYMFGDNDSPHRRLQRFAGGTVDGCIWNETGGYGLNAMLSQLLFIAEALRKRGGFDLYEYEAPGGGNLRKIFQAALARTFSNGFQVRFGANGTEDCRGFDPVGNDEPHLLLPRAPEGGKWDIAYLRYGDPEFAWAALQYPERRYVASKWGCIALWFGQDASEMNVRKPTAPSVCYPEFKVAVMRSDESESYWMSDALTVAARWGGGIYRAHPDQMSFQLHAFGKMIEPDIGYSWDYGCPQGGRNPTPFGYSSYAHNCLVVDRRNNSQEPACLVIDDFGPHVKVLGLAGDAITQSDCLQRVELGRWISLCPEYVLCITYVAYAHLPHTYDLSTPTFAADFEVVGRELEDYDTGADIGYGKIDHYHDLPCESPEQRTAVPPEDHPENVWIKDGRHVKVRGPFTVVCRHEDGVNLALHYGTDDESEIITGKAPRSWEHRYGVQCIPGRYGIVVNRKVYDSRMPGSGRRNEKNECYPHSEANCHFVVAHEPFRAEKGYRIRSVRCLSLEERQCRMWDPNGYEIAKKLHEWTTPRVIEVKSKNFTDYFIYVDHLAVMRGGEPGRVKMETPFFTIDFTGAYAWLRIVEGKLYAQQGEIKKSRLKKRNPK